MGKRTKIMIVFFALGMIGISSYGQDIHFSQFYDVAIFRNPALTGIFSGDYKYGVDYRTQWSSLQVPFTTAIATAETRINLNDVGDCLSFGMAASFDHAGSIDFNSMQIYPAINYSKSLEDVHHSYLSLGFAGGYIDRYVDISKMTFSSQYVNGGFSTTNPSNERVTFNSVHDYDLSVGTSFNSSLGNNNQINYYLGVAAYHLTTPNQSFDGQNNIVDLNTKWSANLGLKYSINDLYALTIHANYTNQYPQQETIFGALLSWNGKDVVTTKTIKIYAGLFCRLNDAIIPTFKLDYERYSITFSYDITTSSINSISDGLGGYEISLFFRGKYKKKLNTYDCPRFEEQGANNSDY
jgi:type IX secretion system PorP/SprF family membrane protein